MPLGDALELLIDHRGQTPGKLGGSFSNAGVPVVSAIHIKKGRVDFEQRRRFVTAELAERWMPQRLRKEDVLLTSEAPLGSVALVPTDEPLVLSQRLFALRGREGTLENRFLYWALQAPQIADQLRARSSGSTVTGIRQSELRQVTIRFPHVAEQRRIVDILEDHLSRLDAADGYLDAVSRRLRTFRAATLSGLTIATDPVITLGSLATDSGYGTSTKCVPGGPGVAVVRIPNLRGGAIDLADEKRAVDDEDLSRLMLQPGDLLVVRTNGSKDLIGRTAVVQPGIEAAFASYLIRYRFNRARVVPEWVHLMLDRPQARKCLEGLAASSAGQYNLGLKKLDGVRIPVPAVDEQVRRIEAFGVAAQRATLLEAAAAESRQRSGAVRRGLLAAAFSGRLTDRASGMNLAEGLAEREVAVP